MRKSVAILIMMMWGLVCMGQGDVVEDVAERMDEEGRMDESVAEELAELGALAEHPLDINGAGEEDLAKLIFLNDNKIRGIIEYREKVGRIEAMEELMRVKGITGEDVERLKACAYAGEGRVGGWKKGVKVNALARVWRRWPQGAEYAGSDSTEAKYGGVALGQLARVEGKVGEVVGFGLVAENDPGEPQLRRGGGLMDYGGWYVSVMPGRGWVKKVVAGHYHLRLGQGLGVWTGFSMSPTTAGISAGRVATGVSGTVSAAETGQLRGGAMEIRAGRVRGTVWGSVTRCDATEKVGEDSAVYISAFRTSGLHRTEAERRYRHNDKVRAMGAYGSVDVDVARLGVGYNVWRTELPLESGGKLYLANRPTGGSVGTWSADAKWYVGSVMAYGEVAWQGRDAWGGVAGMEIDAGGGGCVALSVRRFGKRYYGALGRPVARTSVAAGESGMTLGVSLEPWSGVSVSGVVDWWRMRWLRANVNELSRGWKARADGSVRLGSWGELGLGVRHTRGDTTHLTRGKGRLKVGLGGVARVTTSWEGTHLGGVEEGSGLMLGEDVRVWLGRGVVELSVSGAYFRTSCYDCRVYGRQPRMAYEMRFNALSGEGWSWSGMLKLGLRRVRVWLWGGYVTTTGRFDGRVQMSWRVG